MPREIAQPRRVRVGLRPQFNRQRVVELLLPLLDEDALFDDLVDLLFDGQVRMRLVQVVGPRIRGGVEDAPHDLA